MVNCGFELCRDRDFSVDRRIARICLREMMHRSFELSRHRDFGVDRGIARLGMSAFTRHIGFSYDVSRSFGGFGNCNRCYLWLAKNRLRRRGHG